jgi:O-antigen/teichoic acid export membrane protein
MRDKYSRLKDSLLAKNTFWMLIGQGGRTIIQAVYFIIIARTLGAKGYGAFVGVVALVSLFTPFASWGTGSLLIKNVARDAQSFHKYWGRALAMTVVSSVILGGVLQLVALWFLPKAIPPLVVLSVSVSDLFFARLLEISGQAYQALQRLGRTAQFHFLLSFLRLGAALTLSIMVTSPTTSQWGIFYCLSSALAAMIAVALVMRELGFSPFDFAFPLPEIKEGFFFSIGLSAQNIYNDIDKTMLTWLSTLEATGIYGAAYRIIDVSFVPIRSLVMASYPRFFQHGASGVAEALRLASRLVAIASVYALLIVGGLYLTAPLLPYALGKDYTHAVEAIRWLALLPLLKSVHYFAANTLTGAGYQGLRSSTQVFVAVFNFLINLWLIPLFSWRGAAWASIASDGLLAMSLWVIIGILYRREQEGRCTKRPSLIAKRPLI